MSSDSQELQVLCDIITEQSTDEIALVVVRAKEQGIDIRDIVATALRQGLGPLFLSRLSDAGVDEVELVPLRVDRDQSAVHSLLAHREQRSIQRKLDEHAIPTIWLKGIVFANSVYPSPELRPMVDIDVLVPYEDRERALSAVSELGYTLESTQLFDGTGGQKHHFFLERADSPVQLELHFRLVGYLDRILTVDQHQWFWQHRSSMLLRSSETIDTLTPEAHLLYLCGHAILQHGEVDMRLLRYYDIDRLIAYWPRLDWNKIVNGAVRLRWTYATERALVLASEYFDSAVPASVIDNLRTHRPDNEDIRHAVRRSTHRTLSRLVIDDLAAMGWMDRIQATHQIMAPPVDYMRWRYNLDSNRQLPIAYLRRWRRIASDAIGTITRKRPS